MNTLEQSGYEGVLKFAQLMGDELPTAEFDGLLNMSEALLRMARALKLRPGEAMAEMSGLVRKGLLLPLLLGGPSWRQQPLTDAKVWRPQRVQQGRLGAALVGQAGLAARLEELVVAPDWRRQVDLLGVAIRQDELETALASVAPARASPTARSLPPPGNGELTTNEGPPRALVRLADVVGLLIEAGQPWRDAAEEALQQLAHDKWADAWQLRPGLRAEPLLDDLVLCRGYRSGADRLEEHNERWNESGEEWHMPGMGMEEAEFRGLGHRAKLVALKGRRVYLRDHEWQDLDEVLPLQGRAGVVGYLRYAWTAQAQGPDGLGAGLAGSIAMLRTDAERLFPGLFAAAATVELRVANQVTDHARPCAEVMTLRLASTTHASASASDEGALRQKIKDQKPIVKQKRAWPDKPRMLATLLSQYEQRMQLSGAEAATCEEQLATLWSLKQNSVHSYLTQARKSRKDAEQSAVEQLTG